MKRAKIMFTGLALIGIVGGALAFKAKGLSPYFIQSNGVGACTVTIQYKEVPAPLGFTTLATTESGAECQTLRVTDVEQ